MPLKNRVLATGEIVAHQARGLFMGNRGILHGENKALIAARWRHKAWIICELVHKDWHREVMRPGNYTELFFLDEAVALAAGHRPCALCRRKHFIKYRQTIDFNGFTRSLDDNLHTERAIPRKFQQNRTEGEIASLPDGAIILEETPKLIMQDAVFPIGPDGYGSPSRRAKTGTVTILTPKTSIKALRNGYEPAFHPSLKI